MACTMCHGVRPNDDEVSQTTIEWSGSELNYAVYNMCHGMRPDGGN